MPPGFEAVGVVAISLLVRGKLILLVNPAIHANGLVQAREYVKSQPEQAGDGKAQLTTAAIAGAMQRRASDPALSTAAIETSRTASRTVLTPRQRQVLALLSEGLSNKLICRRLKIAHGTVKVHIAGILRELGASNRVQAVVTARNV